MNYIAKILFSLAVVCFGADTILGQSATNTNSMLCQGNYYTEAEAATVLAQLKTEYTTLKSWKSRARIIKQGILAGADLKKMPKKMPLQVIRHSKRTYEGYSVENIAFESLPGVFVTGSLYSPTQIQGKVPGIISTHGHWSDPKDYGRIRKDAQIRCANFARMGAIVFAYDMVGYGEMAQIGWEHKHPTSLKLQLWNSIRAIDFLVTLPEIDTKKIAATGASGGATQAFLLTAIDKRIAVTAPVVQVSAHFFGGCACESGMPIHKSISHQTNNVEIAALAAPRPMLIVSDGGDWTKNTDKVEFPHIQHIYDLYGQANKVENVHLANEEHDYGVSKRAAVYAFFAKYLNLSIKNIQAPDGTFRESDIVVEAPDKFIIFDAAHPLPKYAVTKNDLMKW